MFVHLTYRWKFCKNLTPLDRSVGRFKLKLIYSTKDKKYPKAQTVVSTKRNLLIRFNLFCTASSCFKQKWRDSRILCALQTNEQDL